MYAGSSESLEAGLRRRTRTAISHQPRQALESATLRNSVSFYSPRRSKVFWERSSSSEDPPKRRVSTFRPGFPSSFLSMSTLHEVEVSETTSTLRDRKSFYAAVGLKRLFRSSSRGSLFGQAQAQANGTADGTGGGGGTQSGSTSLAVPSLGGGDDNSKGRWSLFKRK
ncbi:hypothetical protein BDM02DRAFT_3108982 [Thelephora ganbajun]|uniref:Uncharacterized protein n=1 Tax=Thelephora ganbajun TaxID=370292 RepID=A0ACB6ZSL1_THEGA|nr:hypothetical protein BDM02DRAFT_3108982 [Thelephora ganbajun]